MKTLLLNSSYEVMSFIPFKRAIRLYVNDKVEILSSWDEIIKWTEGEIRHPSILRLKYTVPWRYKKARCTRKSVLKRDLFTCQYCNVVQSPTKLTWDHIIPKSQGGRSTWTNCVAACTPCNRQKGNRSPLDAGMKLLRTPVVPSKNVFNEYKLMNLKHSDWEFYLS